MDDDIITIDVDQLRNDMRDECMGAAFGGGFGGGFLVVGYNRYALSFLLQFPFLQ